MALGIDKGEYLHEVVGGDSSAASFMASVEECNLVRGNVSCMMRDLIVKLSYLCIECLARM